MADRGTGDCVHFKNEHFLFFPLLFIYCVLAARETPASRAPLSKTFLPYFLALVTLFRAFLLGFICSFHSHRITSGLGFVPEKGT